MEIQLRFLPYGGWQQQQDHLVHQMSRRNYMAGEQATLGVEPVHHMLAQTLVCV